MCEEPLEPVVVCFHPFVVFRVNGYKRTGLDNGALVSVGFTAYHLGPYQPLQQEKRF